MNAKLIQQYGEEILCYRLRTARNKRRAQHEDFHKRLIALHKEERALRKQKWNLGWEPLVPPVQKGWKRAFFLRDDVAGSKQADFYEGILKKINTTLWSHRKDFKKKKRAFGRKKYVVQEQFLLKPGEYEFQKFAFTEAERQQSHEEWYSKPFKRGLARRYVFNEPWRFVLKVKPNVIDKVRKLDPELDARIHRIQTHLERSGYDKVQNRLLDISHRWWNGRIRQSTTKPIRWRTNRFK